ncbi:hypothetical protein GCM10029992_08670 [Glycomyces albus]
MEIAVPPPTNPVGGETQMLMDESAIRVNTQLDPARPTEIGAYARVRVTPGIDGATLRSIAASCVRPERMARLT